MFEIRANQKHVFRRIKRIYHQPINLFLTADASDRSIVSPTNGKLVNHYLLSILKWEHIANIILEYITVDTCNLWVPKPWKDLVWSTGKPPQVSCIHIGTPKEGPLSQGLYTFHQRLPRRVPWSLRCGPKVQQRVWSTVKTSMIFPYKIGNPDLCGYTMLHQPFWCWFMATSFILKFYLQFLTTQI